MANALLLGEAARLGDAQGVGVLANSMAQGQDMAAQRQRMNQNALSQQWAGEDRNKMQAQEQEQKRLASIREDYAQFMSLPDDSARDQVWQSGLAQHYGQDPNSDWRPAIMQLTQQPGFLPPEVAERIIQEKLAPKAPDLTTTQRDAKAYATDPNVRAYVDRTSPAAQARIDIQRQEADRRRQESEQKAAAEAEKRRLAKDKFTASAKYSIGLIDEIVKHPGLPYAVGASSMLPVIPGTDAASFVARLDQLGGRQFLEAFESLKGGGQITQIEGEKATNAIARMQRSQKEEDFIAAANEFKAIIQQAIDRQQAAEQFQAPQGGRGFKVLGRVK